MAIPEPALLLAGFVLAHAAWSISDLPEGDLLVPLAVVEANGQRRLLRFEAETQDAAIAKELGERFDYVLVDEYQDTNTLQAGILAALKPDGNGVTVVGDDAQAIYGFRCAEVDNILSFEGRFEPPARVVTLRQNYRSQPRLLALSNALMAESERAYRKELFSDKPPAAAPPERRKAAPRRAGIPALPKSPVSCVAIRISWRRTRTCSRC